MSAKKQCTRAIEEGGELAEEKGMLAMKYILDMDGVRHGTRNKADLAVREKDLGLCFRALDPERWEFAMGVDFLLQSDGHHRTILERAYG